MLSARLANKILPLIVAILSAGLYYLFISNHGHSAHEFLEGCLLRLVLSILLSKWPMRTSRSLTLPPSSENESKFLQCASSPAHQSSNK
ncbi:hypothetical protein M431DRAFT_350796 [Trichoderma harzianum CBS 226.95]|uniref:Uncharacterized protein n=1 Tax=Trichoderma harzianum CBS 226.95 TaxID=983964 RepID=A0A2T4ALT1_TRIHA|nr:hypothetical protein M431DRAFT_350796 [Trichoderma harzianum CBS 226.95]PTB57818.1 hypothetical protein M431DRAFT_350796 [Trichoderma harzianum CBS 226.95]